MIVVNAVCYTSHAQDSTKPLTSIDADLLNILQQKVPKKYTIGSLTTAGNKYYDQSLLTSISGLSVGDEIILPGGEPFAKAITRLWSQNSFSDISVWIIGVEGDKIAVEIEVTERPRLSKVFYRGVSKGNADDLKAKTGFVVGQIVTEAKKQNADRAIRAYYAEKGFHNIKMTLHETPDTAYKNSEIITINIDKGVKVKVNEITFVGNEQVRDLKLKKQLKSKEMSRLTLFPEQDTGGWAPPKKYSFAQYVQDDGFLSFNKTKEVLDPYVRIKLFTSAKFDEKKYTEDKQKLLDYYNKLGYRDAQIMKDTLYYNRSGNLNVNIKVKEGRKYHFGDITWRGNTKYSDSILTAILGIKKGDIYNQELLYNKLGINASAEGGDVSGLYQNYGYLFFHANPVEKSVHGDTIDFEIQMQEGPQASYKYVRIAGNDRTNEHVPRRELRTIPGEIFSREAIMRTMRELGALTFFDPEKINPNP
ncbi:MAG: outer membrane protein assembly factor, partial [Chitinophagaceae bacterium]|nr:outer membrane protein assembly factor [Chitinophagaceae bacterium]